jgi:nucleotidyltransferase substrate binding protein (TIGR01987 family)
MPLIIEGIEFDNLLRARNKFESFRKHLDTEQEKAGAIYAFKQTFHVGLNTIHAFVEMRGGYPSNINGSKDLFRAAACLNFVEDPQKWFDFIEARNKIPGIYNEEEAGAVVATFDDFSEELAKFLTKVGAI